VDVISIVWNTLKMMDIFHLCNQSEQENHGEVTREMNESSCIRRVRFDAPAFYRIQVQGLIPENWRERLEGMSISQRKSDAGERLSTLEGELADQAALAGVLNSVYELHLPILVVEYIGNHPGDVIHEEDHRDTNKSG
jgi:hypothetical protein